MNAWCQSMNQDKLSNSLELKLQRLLVIIERESTLELVLIAVAKVAHLMKNELAAYLDEKMGGS
ncbi:hypothetical protein [Sporosarcina sp. E16_8]|uniref:hypothetical protein n=1 Tax=Sporosarcina sp. E16_8 TaxID=2789295 RepID=UPI001A925576|nr:hypothetical protein [Sporosarcina sp. E16_8]MBO0588903.1 hypothetical protein [Sporosarcina sp. E16_8]